jgi:type II secretory pathway component PulK
MKRKSTTANVFSPTYYVLRSTFSRIRGVALVEVIIGAAIISIAFVGMFGAIQSMLRISRQTSVSVQSAFLAQEGLEALRVMRDLSWDDEIAPLTVATTYYFEWSDDDTWTATTTANMIDGIYTRTFKLENVYRDGSSDIAESGTLDTGSRKATINVVRSTLVGLTSTTTISGYINDLFNN